MYNLVLLTDSCALSVHTPREEIQYSTGTITWFLDLLPLVLTWLEDRDALTDFKPIAATSAWDALLRRRLLDNAATELADLFE